MKDCQLDSNEGIKPDLDDFDRQGIATEVERDAPARAALAAQGAKSLGEAVGAENVGLTNQISKGKQPLQALSDAQRQAAAGFHRGVAERTTGNLSEAAAEFDLLRADFLEGKTTEVPGNINDFIARKGLPRK